MTGIEKLVNQVKSLKEKGQTDREIASELHLSMETVEWLLTRDIQKEHPPADVKIGWRSIGVYPSRARHIADIMVDIIYEEIKKHEEEPDIDSIVGIAHNGAYLGTLVAESLDAEFILFRPDAKELKTGIFGSNYAGVEGKNVVIVDDVLSTGATMRHAIEDVKKEKGNPLMALVLVNKCSEDTVNGVPLRAFIRARVVTRLEK
ncbi:MAG: orotate phosphoribosyltransferase-like protein [Thermoplasmata archaeon]|nr:orotate phosphoribosyltransferase-like protein [Thermoplasmata archaeon]